MSIVTSLEEKRVLILGLGREGTSTFAFLRKHFPQKVLGLADKTPWTELDEQTRQMIELDGHVTTLLGQDYLSSVNQYDIIFKSPGIYPSELADARQNGKVITSNTEVFFECCQGTVIGITGTKGKSTTTSLIYKVLQMGGVDAHLTGNIGIPPLSSLHDTTSTSVFVAELSSYQLMDLHRSPHLAVVQNVVPEHLDYHGSFEAYVNAKQTIAQYQNEDDYVIFNASYPIPTRIASVSKAKKIPFGFNPTGQVGCCIDDSFLTFYSNGCRERIIPIQANPLKGTFNLQNVMPSIIVGKIFGISNEVIANAIQNFQPLEHRLEYVGTYEGVAFYNDSLSTIPEAAISAMQAFPNGSFILLAGGYDRGLDFTELARIILTSKVKAVILFPTTGEKLWNTVVQQTTEGRELPRHIFVTSMTDAVKQAYSLAEKEDIILLSPASSSFSGFKDYRDRGNQFKAEVRKFIDQDS